MKLADYQRKLLKQLVSTFDRTACVVVHGRMGVGKRTVIETASLELGLAFLPVVINAPAREVCRTLLGHENLALPECNEHGLLAQERACVYLSCAEHVDQDLLPVLREAFRARSHTGLWREPHGQVIVLGLNTDDPQPILRETDPLILTTPSVRFPDQLDARDLFQISESILAEMGITGNLVEGNFKNVRLPREGLASLRKWLLNAAVSRGQVDLENFLAAMFADVVPFVEQIFYRGHRITYEEYFDWASQFNPSARPILDHLIRVMVERKYVVSEGDFHQLVNDIVYRSGIPRGSQVALCEWQPFGKSGPVMAHRVKERGNWGSRVITLNLRDDPAVWHKAIAGRDLPVVLADDFVGTGDSLIKVEPRIRLLLEACPNAWVRILLVAGYAGGIQRIRHLEQQYGERVKIVVGRLLYNSDMCFHEASDILLQAERQVLGAFCDEFGSRVRTKIPRGYGGLGALLVFSESIPNTTLPILWYDGKPGLWRPLLPASMIVKTPRTDV